MVFALLVTVGLCGAAVPCTFHLPDPANPAGCLVFDQLGALPAAPALPMGENSSFADRYWLTSPCATLPNQTGLCGAPSASYSGLASPAVQVHGASCVVLGDPAARAGSALPSGEAGIRLTLRGGDAAFCQGKTREVSYDMVCDASAPADSGPDAGVGVPAPCAYTVRWRTPLACPAARAGPAACPRPPPLPAAPVPTASQATYQRHEIMALVHFNMATFAKDGDPGCDAGNWNVKAGYAAGKTSDPKTFHPALLNASQWVEVMHDVGAKHAVLTAKHGCGHLNWKTNTTLPDGRPYGYGVGGAGFGRDVLREFSDAAAAGGVGHGFYYSLTNNFYLNVRSHVASNATGLPGQQRVTQAQFEAIALAQVAELWTGFGPLTEIWFDGGYTSDMKAKIAALLNVSNAAGAAAFGGMGVSANPVCWVGTESGNPGGEIWSTGGNGLGDPASQVVCPKGCDTTLQEGDHWFFTAGAAIRSLGELVTVYHATVGRNGVLELDFAINRDGLVEPAHAARYKELGDWVRGCYGAPVGALADDATCTAQGCVLVLDLGAPKTVDRVAIREDIGLGQRVRGFAVQAMLAGATSWSPFSSGEAVGNKRIDVLGAPIRATKLRLTVTAFAGADALLIKQFAAFAPCPAA